MGRYTNNQLGLCSLALLAVLHGGAKNGANDPSYLIANTQLLSFIHTVQIDLSITQ